VTSREYLFSLEQFGIKLGLVQIRALLNALGQPERAYPAVLIAGTNGKGSVTAMVERALRAAGHHTGRYTSPHLVHIEERIAIDGAPIAPADFDSLADEVRHAARDLPAPPSFFEATTALALAAFRQARVEVAVLEVGLGGRLDATNVLSPMGVAITAIDFDHEQYLGTTIAAIAREKAGVIKPQGLCVLGRNGGDARSVVAGACREVSAELVYAPDGVRADASLDASSLLGGRTRLTLSTPAHDYGEVVLGLRGRHQIDNAVTAVRLLERLPARAGLPMPPEAIVAGVRNVDWPGRLELRPHHGGHVLIDGAHNPAGARALAGYLRDTYGGPLPIVLGVMRDKAIEGIVEALAGCASMFVCTAPASPRAVTPVELEIIVRRSAPAVPVRVVPSPPAAVDEALAHGTPVVVAGSLYLAGEIQAELS
jgi:dihydrofolate synthase/folylpolyglutamate synthase